MRSEASCQRLKTQFASYLSDGENAGKQNVQIVCCENVKVVERAQYVLLGCKPYMVADILGQPGMAGALRRKLLISICAGVTSAALRTAVDGDVEPKEGDCKFVRAMPNTAATIRQSMTVITPSTPPLSSSDSTLVDALFSCVGRIVHLPESLMDASTSLCGSGPAFFLLMLDAAIDGAVAMGIPRKEATEMAAQTMKGAAMNVLGEGTESGEGKHPAVLKDQVTTPGGCTMAGLIVLEQKGVRGAVGECVRRATVVASELGSGKKNVNGC